MILEATGLAGKDALAAVGLPGGGCNLLSGHVLEERGSDKYRSPKLAATVTITLPRFSGRAATRAAAATLAPVLMPTRMPSSLANRRAQAKGVLVGDRFHAAEQARVQVSWG